MLTLRELQSRFFRAIARVPGGSEGEGFEPTLLQLVQGRGRLGPAQRLDLYAHMYFARLLDALHEDFPRVAAILGFERFREIARAYLARNPSAHPSLQYLGRHFPEFLNTAVEDIELLPFLADLARLEWTRLEVFDAPDAEPLQMEHLQAIPLDEWPGLRFRLIPACQVLRSAWPIHELWTAGEEAVLSALVRPAATVVRVWRQGFTVYQASLDAIEQVALDGVQTGEPFAAICAALAPLLPQQEEAALAVGSLLTRWIEDGILARLQPN